jgi:hypothetical protein
VQLHVPVPTPTPVQAVVGQGQGALPPSPHPAAEVVGDLGDFSLAVFGEDAHAHAVSSDLTLACANHRTASQPARGGGS